MSRSRIPKGCKQKQRLDAARLETVRRCQMKQEATLDQAEQLAQLCIRQVDNQLQLIAARTNRQLLQMNWHDFLNLELAHFEDYKSEAPRSNSLPRSLSLCPRQTPRSSRSQLRTVSQSVDRAELRRRDKAVLGFMRWPKPGEVPLSKCGSPLAVQLLPDKFANVQIPTKKGVLTLHPQKLSEVKREVLRQLDEDTLNQIKTLHANLHLIVDLAQKTSLGKGKKT